MMQPRAAQAGPNINPSPNPDPGQNPDPALPQALSTLPNASASWGLWYWRGTRRQGAEASRTTSGPPHSLTLTLTLTLTLLPLTLLGGARGGIKLIQQAGVIVGLKDLPNGRWVPQALPDGNASTAADLLAALVARRPARPRSPRWGSLRVSQWDAVFPGERDPARWASRSRKTVSTGRGARVIAGEGEGRMFQHLVTLLEDPDFAVRHGAITARPGSSKHRGRSSSRRFRWDSPCTARIPTPRP